MIRPWLFRNKLENLLLVLLLPVFTRGAVCYSGMLNNDPPNNIYGTTATAIRNHDPASVDKFNIVRSSHRGVAADHRAPLQITFNQPVDANSMKSLIVTEGGAEAEPLGADSRAFPGKWILSADLMTITFRPLKKIKPGMFVSVTVPQAFKSLRGSAFMGGKDIISFITDNGTKNGQRIIKIDTLKIVDNHHRIPLIMSVPDNSETHPVLIFVHGGGWSGGSETLSSASLPGGYTASYLTDKLGIAVVGVGYRCIGSKGNFAKAKADIEDAVRYVKANADKYNLDLNKLGICGESAGAPLSAMIAQEDRSINYYIGWNGIYDFVNDSDGKFGQGNGYGQEEPSAQSNSALYHIREAPPATLLLHGTNDSAINHRQSVAFSCAIQNAGGYAKLLSYEGQPHWYFYAPGGKYEISSLYQVKQFLIKRMALKVK